MYKKKITELVVQKWRTVHDFDEEGNRVREQVPYDAYREVRTIGSGARFGHYIADRVIHLVFVFCFLVAISILISVSDRVDGISLSPISMDVLLRFSIFLSYPLYCAICEATFQRTPGKFLTKSLVIDEYGEQPDFGKIMLRSIIRLVPFDAFSCLDSDSYGWHDRWSKTWVVTEAELAEIRILQQEQSDNYYY